jgi:hypothetical protein
MARLRDNLRRQQHHGLMPSIPLRHNGRVDALQRAAFFFIASSGALRSCSEKLANDGVAEAPR